MEKHIKAYGIFLAFLVLTNAVVRPIAQKTGLPLISQI